MTTPIKRHCPTCKHFNDNPRTNICRPCVPNDNMSDVYPNWVPAPNAEDKKYLPAELRALADRVEEGTATVTDVSRACGHRVHIDGPTPTYLTSLDAAASIMPDGWDLIMTFCANDRVAIQAAPAGTIGKWVVISTAPTECAARVAAALRARAYRMGVDGNEA